MSSSVVIIGVGNLLAGDDGIGVRAAHLLAARDDLPDGVRVLDGGVVGMDLLVQIEVHEKVVLLDAVRTGASPGELHRIPLEDVPKTVFPEVSVHELGVGHLLFVARTLGRPLRGTLVGVEPGRIDPFTAELSPAVAPVLPELAEAGLREARRLLEA